MPLKVTSVRLGRSRRGWKVFEMRALKWWLRGLGERLAPRLTFAFLANRSWLHEPEIALLPLLSNSNGLAVDAGANKGVYLYHLCRRFQRVVAFEPLPQMAAYLAHAAPINAEVHGLALSNAAGVAEIRLPRGYNELASLETTAGVAGVDADIEVHTTPLATLDSFGLGPVGLVKIDVEGHELNVLEGARSTLQRFHPTVLIEVEERHRRGAIARVRALLEELGYEGYFLDGSRVRPVSEFDPARDQNAAALSQSVKVGRYINNFIYFDRRQAAERAALINRHLALPVRVRVAAIAALESQGVEPAWHRFVAPWSAWSRRGQTNSPSTETANTAV